MYGFYSSPSLAFNASATEVAQAIGNLSSSVGVALAPVTVQRGLTSSGSRTGVDYNITFSSYNGDPAALQINSTYLTGLSLTATTTTLSNGVASDIQVCM